MIENGEVAVFWDIENCPPPSKMRGISVERQLRKALRQYGRIYQINAYAEVMKIPENLRVELQRSGIHLIETPHVKEKEVADFMIITDMYVFAHKNNSPQRIALISGDAGFAYSLAKLRQLDYEVVLIVPPTGVSSILRNQADIILEWNEIMEVQESVIEDTELRYEPLLQVIDTLSEKGVEEPTLQEIEQLLNTKYPKWSKTSGFESVNDYVVGAESNNLVIICSNDEESSLRMVESESEEIDISVSSRFEPLITVLNQLTEKDNNEPEMAIIGVTLRTLMTDPLEKLGVSRLKDYIMEAKEEGIVNVRQDGLQYYVSLKTEGPEEELTLEEKDTLELLEKALASLKDEMIMPTPRAVVGRMSELQPKWNLASSIYKNEEHLVSKAQKHIGIRKKSVGATIVIFPRSGEFQFVDLMDKSNPYTPKQWVALYDFLLENKDKWVKGRYAYAKKIQGANIEQLKDLKLGHILHMVQLAINEAILGKKIGSWDTFIPIENNISVMRKSYLTKMK